jgi:hypothetical protein
MGGCGGTCGIKNPEVSTTVARSAASREWRSRDTMFSGSSTAGSSIG